MGVKGKRGQPKKDEGYSEESIQRVLNLEYLSNPRYLIHNLYVFKWESDYLACTRAGYWYEVEIKISLADFKNDFSKKQTKHAILRWGSYWNGQHYTAARPNYFSYCVPFELVEKVLPLVPPYAGLLCVDKNKCLRVIRPAPRLHVQKYTDEQLRLAEKFYYNWVEERRKNREHDSLVRGLREEIRYLKAEYKAVVGEDVDYGV
jgi:hypothetical protein